MSLLRRKVGDNRATCGVWTDWSVLAKHLEPLKGGKVPIEILVRGKDAEQNAKQFEKCLDIIKGAGVCYMIHVLLCKSADIL